MLAEGTALSIEKSSKLHAIGTGANQLGGAGARTLQLSPGNATIA
jgi:hypothetical protein